MTPGLLPVPSSSLPKALVVARELRRAILSYWYATLEDQQAAAIEATNAVVAINILDEAVFEGSLGDPYLRLRANDRKGQVVTGLELVRNCEIHGGIVFDGLLVARAFIGIPPPNAGYELRTVYHWADYGDLPHEYLAITSENSTNRQKRARKESRHGYRQGVAGRNVVDALLDALAFFQELDTRLIESESLTQRYAFGVAELPGNDADDASGGMYLARPLGLDTYEVFLPDIACRWWERRAAKWRSADGAVSALVAKAKNERPSRLPREILFRVSDQSGKVVAFSGNASLPSGGLSSWVERRRQVWSDVRSGCAYFVRDGDDSVLVHASENVELEAPNATGIDLLAQLSEATEDRYGLSRLIRSEDYPDLYLAMRLE